MQSKDEKYFVYIHKRISDGTPFYVGLGSGNRHIDGNNRNDDWYEVVNEEGGISFVIVADKLSKEEANQLETNLIEGIGKNILTNILKTGRKRKRIAKEFWIDGVHYTSQTAAAEAIGISQPNISVRLRSDEWPNYTYDAPEKDDLGCTEFLSDIL